MNPVVKQAYKAMPLKKQLFSMIRAFWLPRFYQRMYFNGPFKLKINELHTFQMIQHNRYGIETELFWKGLDEGWETASLAIWVKLCQKSEVILDIGAAEGLYALVAQSLRPETTILAFEPLPQPMTELRRNIELNGYNVSLYQQALSNYTGEADFYAESESSNEGSLVSSASASASALRVSVTTLANVIEEAKLAQVDLMKIDVEGAEPQVLEGMGLYLGKYKPSMIIEILNDEVGKRVEQLLDGLGYLYFDINDDSRKGPKTIRPLAHIKKSICLNYLVVQPHVAHWLGLGLIPEEMPRLCRGTPGV